MPVRSTADTAPGFSSADAEQFALKLFGREGRAKALPSERDQNFLIEIGKDRRFVLKISNSRETRGHLEFQNRVIDHVSGYSARKICPRLVPSVDGNQIEQIKSGGGRINMIRLQEYLEGKPLGNVRPHSEELLIDLGCFTASLVNAFAGLEGEAVGKDFIWNPENGPGLIRSALNLFDDEDDRALLMRLLERVESEENRIFNLPKGLIHNDGNDYNLIVSLPEIKDLTFGKRNIAGIIDFGDLVHTWRLNELAVVLAYAMLDKKNPLPSAAKIVEGYHSVRPLDESELEALYYLVILRLMMSVTISAVQKKMRPDDDYLTISEKGAWTLLNRLSDCSPRFVQAVFRRACGQTPCPHTKEVCAHLRSIQKDIFPVLGRPLNEMPLCVFDLSVGSPLFSRPGQTDDPDLFGRILKLQMEESGACIGIGRYNEARLMYTSPVFSTGDNELDESRTIHLGMDVFKEAGTAVYAPLDGTVLSAADLDRPLDYGPTLILRHVTSGEGTPFFTLYGHLNRGSLDHLEPGAPVKKGEKIAELGDSTENGGWPPHLHFQVMTDMLHFREDFQGVAPASERDIWLSFCPDPNMILLVPEDRLKPMELEREEVLRRRKSRLGPSLSLSYRSPLKMVRGFMQYMYTETGRRYLDAVNNVPQVGHSHPRVAAAVQKQQAVLNTNTRYLHDRIVEYAERLTQMLPEPLSVCFFVNSGSEANDLALRLAENATGGTETIVLDAAYHGNLSSLIAISPYKFNGPGGKGKPSSTHIIPMPDPYRGEYKGYGAASGRRYADHLRAVAENIGATGKKVKAFIAESLMGCGGQIVFPSSFLDEAYKWVRKAGGVCIADEVQIGFGRVGTHFWGFETQNVMPDIVTLGKPIGNGFPLGAVITTRAIAETFAGGMEYFNTFGGNPVSCAAGMAVLDILRDEQLQDNALKVGEYLKTGLLSLQKECRFLGDVRGMGLFIGLEFVTDPKKKTPDALRAGYLVERMKEECILLSTDGPDHNVIKIKPPLVFSKENADLFLNILTAVLKEEVFGPDGF